MNDVLNKYGLYNCRTTRTPKPQNTDTEYFFDPTTYRSAVGSLIYLAICTRPDILFDVNQASKHCQESTDQDWKNVVQIFRYLKRISGYGILFKRKGNLKTHVDSDYGGDNETRKSTIG